MEQKTLSHDRAAELQKQIDDLINQVQSQKTACQLLQAQNEAITKAYPDIHFIVDRSGAILEYAAGATENLYVSPEQFLGKRMADVLPTEVGIKFNEVLAQAVKTGSVQTIEYVLHMPQAATWYEARLVKIDHNKVMIIVRDIQIKKQAELGLLEQKETLKKEQRAVIDNFPYGICIIDKTYHVTLTNKAGKKYIDEFVKKNNVESIGGLGLSSFSIIQNTTPITLPLPSDKNTLIEVIVKSIGPDKGWIVTFRDVTSEQDKQKQIIRQERLAAIGQLAAGIAHDFNNTLTVITGFAQILEMREDIDEQTRDDLNQIYKQGQRGAQMIRQILDFSRSVDENRQPTDLMPFLKESAKLLRHTLPETIDINTNFSSETNIIKANLPQMQQVITNLALNARDAMPQGGTLHIATQKTNFSPRNLPPIDGMAQGEWLELILSDTGVGISQHDLPRIYEPFFSTKKMSEGTGLGLSQVYGIVKQHDGYIDIRSEIDKGTHVHIFFPLIKENTDSNWESPPIILGNGETILIAEDDFDVLTFLQRSLNALNYNVLTAHDGIEALTIYTKYKNEIRAVIIDLVMPQKGGLEVLKELSQNPTHPPIIIMSGYLSIADIEQEKINQADGFINKPLNMQAIGSLVYDLLHPKSQSVHEKGCLQ